MFLIQKLGYLKNVSIQTKLLGKSPIAYVRNVVAKKTFETS